MPLIETLEELDILLKKQRPLFVDSLNPGATDEQLSELRRALLTDSLPFDVEKLLRWHNGQANTVISIKEGNRLLVKDVGGIKPGYEFLSSEFIVQSIESYGNLIADEIAPTLFRHFVPLFYTSSRRDVGLLIGVAKQVIAIDTEYREIYLLSHCLENFIQVVIRSTDANVYDDFANEEVNFFSPPAIEIKAIKEVDGEDVFPTNIYGLTRFGFNDQDKWPTQWRHLNR